MFSRSERSRVIAEATSTSCAGGYYLSDDSTTDTSSSFSDSDEMHVYTSHGKMKVNLLANEPDNTPNEYGVSYDNATCCTAGLITDLRKLKGMHIRETMNSDPTPAQSRRLQYWQTTPVGFLMDWQSLRYVSQ